MNAERERLEREFMERSGLPVVQRLDPAAWQRAIRRDECQRCGVDRRNHYSRLHAFVEPSE